jgi:hypothetical protein
MHSGNPHPNLRLYRVHFEVNFTARLTQLGVLTIKLRKINLRKPTQRKFDARVRDGVKIERIKPKHRMGMNWGLRLGKRT